MYLIGEFAKRIGVIIQTLREWDKSGKLKPEFRSKGRHIYYSDNQLNEILQKSAKFYNTKLMIINKNEEKTDEEGGGDILNIIHVFSCRLNGKRSHINKKIIKELEK